METIELKVSICYGWPFPGTRKWEATLKDWDLGTYIGGGSTIQEAIDDFLDMTFGEENVNFKWT